jgi:hypothetical protein
MTYVGLDVRARSTHAAAIEVVTRELHRARFSADSEEVVAWLAGLPQPLRGCYEAGPTGFALYRAAQAAGLDLCVIAPSKTPRASGDRIKTDRKDAAPTIRGSPGRETRMYILLVLLSNQARCLCTAHPVGFENSVTHAQAVSWRWAP